MRVLIVNTLYYPYKIGGAEVSVQLLAEELTRKGHQVRVVCLHHEKEKKRYYKWRRSYLFAAKKCLLAFL